MRDGAHLFDIAHEKFCKIARSRDLNSSKLAFAKFLGVSQGKMQQWEKGQFPKADDLKRFVELLGFNAHWLLTGEGDPFDETVAGSTPPGRGALRPIPMVGLASCGVEGWNQVTSIAVSASPLIMGENMVAVLAAGESMVPAGIASGQVCYCDPDQPVLEGDAVYVVRRDNMATIKLYLGEGERAGLIRLKGWQNADEEERRRPFTLELSREEVVQMAPVIYVRRRL